VLTRDRGGWDHTAAGGLGMQGSMQGNYPLVHTIHVIYTSNKTVL